MDFVLVFLLTLCGFTELVQNQIFLDSRCITSMHETKPQYGAHLHVIAPWQNSFFRRNVAAVASRWQHCARFGRPEIWTSNLPLQRRMRYRSTNGVAEWFCRYGWLRNECAELRFGLRLCYSPELKYKLNLLYLIIHLTYYALKRVQKIFLVLLGPEN